MSTSDHDSDDEQTNDDDVRRNAIIAMKQWFRQRYEDPANRTPYESAEGGYIWIWGGPYDAGGELSDNFSGEYPDEWIEEAVEDLEHDCVEWAPVPSEH